MASVHVMLEAVLSVLSFLNFTFCFFIGICFGILLTVVVLVAAFFCLTKRIGSDAEMEYNVAQREPKEKKNLEPKVDCNVQHPNIMQDGKFESYVWIVSGLDWDVNKPIHKFPPPDYGFGDTKGLMKYYAEAKDRVLSFSWIDQTQKKNVMKMELDGCQCRVVRECLGTKSQWWRKAPLEISHPSRCLYQGSNQLFMFCMHGADKEQWYVTLSRNMEPGDSIKVLQHLYKRFSKQYRRKTAVKYPGKRASPLEQRVGEKGNGGERNPWFGGWRRGSRVQPFPTTAVQKSGTKPMELAEEIEQLWNGGKSHSVFTEEVSRRQYRQQNRKNKINKRTSSLKVISSASRSEKQTKTNAVPLAPISSSEATNLAEHKATDAVDSGNKNLEKNAIDLERTATSSSDNQKRAGRKSDDSDFADVSGNIKADGIYGLNMFLARWMFDLVRNPDFNEKFHQAILKRLRGLRRPAYVAPLALRTLDLGSNSPEIRSIRSLPPQGTVICPELLVDISYAGGLEVTVETFVDLREASAWETLDRALNTLQGNQVNAKAREETDELIDDDVDVLDDGTEVGAVPRDSESKEPSSFSNSTERLQSGFSMRKFAALKAKQLAERMAESISKIPLRLSVKVVKLEGTLMAWISPPPAKRLWISFLETPIVEITAKPLLANRVMKYSVALGRVSAWLQRKLKQSFFNSLVFPNCADLPFPGLLSLEDPSGLKHPGMAVMNALTQVSECDSGESDSEMQPPAPITKTLSSENLVPHAKSASLRSLPVEMTEEEEDEEDAQTSINPGVRLPTDERLSAIRKHRFETQHFNSFRKSWNGSPLAEEQIPSRESHGCTVYKRCLSYSDGDVSEQTSEENDAQDDMDGVMSDCIEFFDPDSTFSDNPSTPVSEEDVVSNSTATPPVKRTDDKSQQSKPQMTLSTDSESSVKGVDHDSPTPCTRQPSNRTLGSRFGNLVRSMQSAAEEMEAARRRRNANQGTGNNGFRGARLGGEGGARHKVRDMLENRTAQLRNSGLTKMWSQRRPAEHRERTE